MVPGESVGLDGGCKDVDERVVVDVGSSESPRPVELG